MAADADAKVQEAHKALEAAEADAAEAAERRRALERRVFELNAATDAAWKLIEDMELRRGRNGDAQETDAPAEQPKAESKKKPESGGAGEAKPNGANDDKDPKGPGDKPRLRAIRE
jgi:hypothetical protein